MIKKISQIEQQLKGSCRCWCFQQQSLITTDDWRKFDYKKNLEVIGDNTNNGNFCDHIREIH